MASHVHTVGLIPARFLLTPATATWTLPFAAASQNEPGAKNKTKLGKTEFGKTEMSCGEDPQSADPLFLAGKCLGNYLETAPMAMILAAVAELNGGNRRLVNYALGALFVGKVAQIEFGLTRKGAQGGSHAAGFLASQGILAGMAGYCAYLVRDYWRL